MREHLRILNSKEVRHMLGELNDHFGTGFSTDNVFLENNKERIFMLSRDYGRIDDKKLRINNLGVYFCAREKDGFRLSLEGSQLINAKKNIYNATKEEAGKWIAGEILKIEAADLDGYVIVKYKEDAIGCGKYREGEILNSVPKDRRISKVEIKA